MTGYDGYRDAILGEGDAVLSRILGATEAEELIGDEETEGAPSERAGFQQAPNHVTDL